VLRSALGHPRAFGAGVAHLSVMTDPPESDFLSVPVLARYELRCASDWAMDAAVSCTWSDMLACMDVDGLQSRPGVLLL